MGRRYGRRRYAGSRYSSSRSIGIERAQQHIREAEALSRELGGTDKDVKEYFFSLSPAQLSQVLQLYGQRYGQDARDYAVQTMSDWRSGRRKMAGQTASRLFNLLPPLMPIGEKYKLTEGLWRHVGPSSKRRLRVGADASVDDALAAARDHVESVVSGYQIPDGLARRFEWLSAGDVSVKQQLLNHVQGLEKKLVVEDLRQRLPVLINHLRQDSANLTKRVAHTLVVGKHELEVLVDGTASGVQLEEWRPISSTGGGGLTWLWWVLAIGAAVLFFALKKHH